MGGLHLVVWRSLAMRLTIDQVEMAGESWSLLFVSITAAVFNDFLAIGPLS